MCGNPRRDQLADELGVQEMLATEDQQRPGKQNPSEPTELGQPNLLAKASAVVHPQQTQGSATHREKLKAACPISWIANVQENARKINRGGTQKKHQGEKIDCQHCTQPQKDYHATANEDCSYH